MITRPPGVVDAPSQPPATTRGPAVKDAGSSGDHPSHGPFLEVGEMANQVLKKPVYGEPGGVALKLCWQSESTLSAGSKKPLHRFGWNEGFTVSAGRRQAIPSYILS